MKKTILLLLLISAGFSCQTIAKTAAKHWTKKQIKNFRKSCLSKSEGKFKEDKAAEFCSCVTDIMMEKQPDAEKAMQMDFTQLVKEAGKCAF